MHFPWMASSRLFSGNERCKDGWIRVSVRCVSGQSGSPRGSWEVFSVPWQVMMSWVNGGTIYSTNGAGGIPCHLDDDCTAIFLVCGVVIAKVRRVIGIAWTIMMMMMMMMVMMMVKMVVIMRMTNTDYINLYP